MGPVLMISEHRRFFHPTETPPMKPVDDLSRSLVAFDQECALVAVIELSNRDLARLAVVGEQIEAIERDRLARLQQAPQSRSSAMVALLARVRRRRHRDRRHAGPGDPMAPAARSSSPGALRGADWIAR